MGRDPSAAADGRLTRRDVLRGATMLSLLGVAAGCGSSGDGGSASPTTTTSLSTTSRAPVAPIGGERNFLVLCIDDLNDWTGFLGGYPDVRTPNMDALAAESVNFTHAYCSVPQCLPSRASAIWGRRPDVTGLIGNPFGTHLPPEYRPLLRDLDSSLPVVMHQLGYETLSTGKVAHAFVDGMFDTTLPYPEIRDFLDRSTPEFTETGRDYGLIEDGAEHLDQTTAQWIAEQLAADRRTPFLAMVGLFQPHVPWRLPQWAFDEYPIDTVVVPEAPAGDLDDVPAPGVDLAIGGGFLGVSADERIEQSGRRAELVQAYLAAITHTDVMVGQILDALASSRYADDTTVILWSDNGFHLGEKLHWGKATLWERATRVPFLIRDPDLGAGEFAEPVSLLDLAPTIVDLAGGTAPSTWDGASLAGVDPAAARQRPALMFWEGHRSVRSEQWRYTEYTDGSVELYDTADDPDELTNLAVDPAVDDVVRRLRDQLPG